MQLRARGCGKRSEGSPLRYMVVLAWVVAAALAEGCSGREAAERAIAARVEEIIRGASQLDVEAALRPYANDPAFRMVTPDGAVLDYPTMKRGQEEAFKTMSALSFTTVREDFTFLTDDVVICTWVGRNEFTLKTGERMKVEPYVGSMTFRRVGSEWTIIYAHETTAQPVIVKADKE